MTLEEAIQKIKKEQEDYQIHRENYKKRNLEKHESHALGVVDGLSIALSILEGK